MNATQAKQTVKVLAKGVCRHCRPDLYPGGSDGYYNLSMDSNSELFSMAQPLEIDGHIYRDFAAVFLCFGHNRVIVLNDDNGPQLHACGAHNSYPREPSYIVDVLEVDHIIVTLAN